MSISKRERATPGPKRPARVVAASPSPSGGLSDPQPADGADESDMGSAEGARLSEAIAAQDKAFAVLRSYPLEAGADPAIVFRP